MRRDTKDAILQSAIGLFSRKGFNATTTLEIAQQAGVAEITVFRHFKTKKDILMAVLAHFLDSFGQSLILNPISEILTQHSGESRKEILHLVVKDRIELLQKNSDIIWIVLTESKYHAELKEKIMGRFGEDAWKLIHALFPQNAGPHIRPGRNEVVLRAFIGTVLALVLQYEFLSDILPTEKSLDEAIDDAVDILLNGIENS